MVKIGKRKVLQRCGVKLEPKMFTECKRSCVMPTHAQTQRKKYCGHRGRVCTCTCTCILKCMQVQQAKRARMHICACMCACIHAHARAYPNACKYNSGRKRNLDLFFSEFKGRSAAFLPLCVLPEVAAHTAKRPSRTKQCILNLLPQSHPFCPQTGSLSRNAS